MGAVDRVLEPAAPVFCSISVRADVFAAAVSVSTSSAKVRHAVDASRRPPASASGHHMPVSFMTIFLASSATLTADLPRRCAGEAPGVARSC